MNKDRLSDDSSREAERERDSRPRASAAAGRETSLNEDTVDRLKDLVRINQDSAKGFEATADQVKSEKVADLMRKIAAERRGFADGLRQHVRFSDDEVTNEGSVRAQVHRWWVNLRGTVQDGDVHAMLSEAEKAEDRIKELYAKALEDTSGSPVHPLLQEQFESVRKGHDRIRDLRDGFKEA